MQRRRILVYTRLRYGAILQALFNNRERGTKWKVYFKALKEPSRMKPEKI